MRIILDSKRLAFLAVPFLALGFSAQAHTLRPSSVYADLEGCPFTAQPTVDWNQLSEKVGEKAITWTLDGEALNDLTFFCDIQVGEPLLKEHDRKHNPLPKYSENQLLIEIPEFYEKSVRTAKGFKVFELKGQDSAKIGDIDAVKFVYEFQSEDLLPYKGVGYAFIRNGRLCIIRFEAPRLNYFSAGVVEFEKIVQV